MITDKGRAVAAELASRQHDVEKEDFMFGHKTLARGKRYAHLSEAHTHSVVERRNRAVFGEP